VIDGALLLWVPHLYSAIKQGLHLPGEEKLYRPLNAVVIPGQHAFVALGDVDDGLAEQALGWRIGVAVAFNAMG
jgi:hypothetical protein